MPTLPILYCHPESGFGYKAALAMTLMDIAFEQRHIDVFAPRESRPADFLAASPYGEVPLLCIDGQSISQSNLILLFLATRTGRLDGEGIAGHLRVREWIHWEANRISMSVAHARYSRRFEAYAPEVQSWHDRRARADLDRMTQTLVAQDFLAGATITIADVACCAYLYWADQAGIDLAHWPAVQAWLARIAAQPGWKSPAAMFAST
jgi:glutathione S-transferase